MNIEEYKLANGSIPTKDFRLSLKSVNEDGTFEGMASVYNVVDYGNDVVLPGAFTKTIKENSGKVPMFWQHDEKQPIGNIFLEDSAEGLKVKGKFTLAVQRAIEAYGLLKDDVIRGLSIGYRAVKHEMKNGARNLHEIQLFEVSLVSFPMLSVAQVSSVKADGTKSDFLAELALAQTYAMRYMMLDALHRALDSILWNQGLDTDSKVNLSGDSIDQFRESYVAHLPALLTAWGEMKALTPEAKAGRKISAATRKEIEGAIGALRALLEDEAEATSEALEAGKAAEREAATKTNEPDPLHSWLRKAA